MAQSQSSQYFESKVLTAPPHRLHLLLIEGAIRCGKEAETALRRGDTLAADAPSLRLIDIVGELLVGVRQTKTELNRRIAELYLFVFRLVGEAKVNDDPEKLAVALRLLEYERQTWQLVCDKIGSGAAPVADAATSSVKGPKAASKIAPALGGPAPHMSLGASPGISLEA